MLSKKIKKDDSAESVVKQQTPKNEKKGGKAKIIALVGIAVVLCYQLGVFDSLMGFLSSTVQKSSPQKTVLSAESDKGAINDKINARQSVQQDSAPPIITDTSFNELQNLYLLVSRIDPAMKSAAELYGLQRINIHNKREQAKETKLSEVIAKSEANINEALKRSQDISSGLVAARSGDDITDDVTVEVGKYPFNHDIDPSQRDAFSQDANVFKSDTRNEIDTKSLNSLTKRDVTVSLVLQNDSGTFAVVNVKGAPNPLRNVRKGQILVNQFEVESIDPVLGCTKFNDLNNNNETFTSCAN